MYLLGPDWYPTDSREKYPDEQSRSNLIAVTPTTPKQKSVSDMPEGASSSAKQFFSKKKTVGSGEDTSGRDLHFYQKKGRIQNAEDIFEWRKFRERQIK